MELFFTGVKVISFAELMGDDGGRRQFGSKGLMVLNLRQEVEGFFRVGFRKIGSVVEDPEKRGITGDRKKVTIGISEGFRNINTKICIGMNEGLIVNVID